jgi:predicted ATPase
MHISNVQVENYKSFLKSPNLELSPGFNLITGPNNAGKTALLEALSLRFTAKPHRSVKTHTLPPDEQSSLGVSFVLSRDELWQTFKANLPTKTYWLQLPPASSPLGDELGLFTFDTEEVMRFVDWFADQPSYQFDLRRRAFRDNDKQSWAALEGDKSSVFSLPGSVYFTSITVDPYERVIKGEGRATDRSTDDIGIQLASLFADRVYSFKAERFALGSYERGLKEPLLPDARNLANVLDHFQDNATNFREYTEVVREVLPQIKQIGVRPHTDPQIRKIVIWTDAGALRANDLGFTLEECGTGVGQVLAMLYIAHTEETSMTIIIDEPQSFLHPGAARKLIEILRNYSHHQYIIATHSPTIISATNAKSIILVNQENSESSLQVLDVTKVENQSLYLNSIGATLSDVFGYDCIFWVEGKTEETCFPLVLEKLSHHKVPGTAIVGLVNTGDLKGKDKTKVLEIYQRLTSTTALIPPAIGFVFDREELTATEMEDLKRSSGGRIHFLKRRMYENYLLNAKAISEVLSSLEEIDCPGEDEVLEWLNQATSNKKYFRTTRGPARKHAENWQNEIDGAHVLQDLFSRVHVTYNKVVHGQKLTEWMIVHDKEGLQELASFLMAILPPESSPH